jgi:hypothetical protein
MGRRFFERLNNWSGTLALFLVLTGGTAMAVDGSLPGQNTVGSADIINGEVTQNDLGADSVGTGKIIDGQVKNQDLGGGASNTNTIQDGGVWGIDVKDNSLTGVDIDESTLSVGGGGGGVVPAVRATSPDNPNTFDGQCYHYGTDVQNNGVSTVLRFAAEDYDVGGNDADGLHTDAPDCDELTARLQAPTTGIYLITGMARWQGEDNNCSNCEYGFREISIRKDGSATLARETEPATVVAGGTAIENNPTSQTVTTVAKLNANSYVELLARHNHASSLLQVVDINESHFTMTWLGPAP